MKTIGNVTVRFTHSELAAVKQAMRLLGLEMQRRISIEERSIEFYQVTGQAAGNVRKMLGRNKRTAIAGRLAERAIRIAEGKPAKAKVKGAKR